MDALHAQLLSKGVDASILEEVFGTPAEPGSPGSNPMPKRRMLPSNAGKAEPSKPKATIGEPDNSLVRGVVEKQTQNWSGTGKVVLVLNYSDKSHALFGDFGKTYVKFKEDYLDKQKWLSGNGRLHFGHGWILKVKDKVGDLRTALNNAGIKFREVERPKFESEIASGSSVEEKEAESPENSPKPVPKKVADKKTAVTKPSPKAAPPKASKPAPKAKIPKNAWGNHEEEDTGFVYHRLPVGPKGKMIPVVIGIQDPEPEDDLSGLETVIPLTDDFIAEIEERGKKYLTAEMIELVRKRDKDLAEQLDDLQSRADDDDDDLDDEDDDLDDEDDEDDLDDEDGEDLEEDE